MSGLRLNTLFTTSLAPWEERHHGKQMGSHIRKGPHFPLAKATPRFLLAIFQALIAPGPTDATWWVFTGEGLCLVRDGRLQVIKFSLLFLQGWLSKTAELWSISNIFSPSNYFINSTLEGRRHGHTGREESMQAQDSEPLRLAHTVRCPLPWDLWPVPVSCTGCSAPQLPDD